MRLQFLSFDIIVTPIGDYASGGQPGRQWAWIEDSTGRPIAVAIADAMEGRTP
jgi:hypothetical protein